MSNEPRRAGRHFLQIPGPTPVPERILNAMSRQMLDHRGPKFQKFGLALLASVKTIFKTSNPVIIFPPRARARGRRRSLNTLSPGDSMLIFETGQFAVLWRNMAEKLGLKPEVIAHRLAQRRRCHRHRGAAQEGQGARHQGRVRRAQRDLDGRHLGSTRSARRSTRRSIRRC